MAVFFDFVALARVALHETKVLSGGVPRDLLYAIFYFGCGVFVLSFVASASIWLAGKPKALIPPMLRSEL